MTSGVLGRARTPASFKSSLTQRVCLPSSPQAAAQSHQSYTCPSVTSQRCPTDLSKLACTARIAREISRPWIIWMLPYIVNQVSVLYLSPFLATLSTRTFPFRISFDVITLGTKPLTCRCPPQNPHKLRTDVEVSGASASSSFSARARSLPSLNGECRSVHSNDPSFASGRCHRSTPVSPFAVGPPFTSLRQQKDTRMPP